MEILALAIVFCFLVHTYLTEKVKRKVAYVVHVQERTEEAETLDFAVHLFDDESPQDWAFKLERAYSIAEARRKYQNERMLKLYEEAKKKAEEEKASNITQLKKS